jgi:putative endonuclease
VKGAYVYILSSKRNGTLYVGITSDLIKRIYDHKTGIIKGFTEKYGVKNLVYYESGTSIKDAILREKQLKRWNRAWKLALIEKNNPEWKDLYPEIIA